MSYAKLKGKIKEVFETQGAFSAAMGVDASTMSLKLNNRSPWTREEIEKACDLLHIDIQEVYEYFFTVKVGKTQQ